MTLNQIYLRLKKLGLINEENEPILYSRFKNRATIHSYKAGRGLRRVVFIGSPDISLFGFYHPFKGSTDTEIMKEAYARFQDLVKGDTSEFEAGAIQWGNCGIPETYSNLVKN